MASRTYRLCSEPTSVPARPNVRCHPNRALHGKSAKALRILSNWIIVIRDEYAPVSFASAYCLNSFHPIPPIGDVEELWPPHFCSSSFSYMAISRWADSGVRPVVSTVASEGLLVSRCKTTGSCFHNSFSRRFLFSLPSSSLNSARVRGGRLGRESDRNRGINGRSSAPESLASKISRPV